MKPMPPLPRKRLPLAVALVLCAVLPVRAQDHAAHLHGDHGNAPSIAGAVEASPATQPADSHADHHPPAANASPPVDPHAAHRMATPAPGTRAGGRSAHHPPNGAALQVDHAAMGHGSHGEQAAPSPDLPPTAAPITPIPPLEAADRAASFPPTHGHTTHDNRAYRFAMLDRLETSDAGNALSWEGSGWFGTDLDRLWLRSEGEHVDGDLESADVEMLYGRAVARWWNAVVGIRHDFGERPSQTFIAAGVMGLAPGMFEVEATAYVGSGGQTGLAVEAEYETLFTNRLILQSVVEAEAWGRDDIRRGLGSGLGTVEAGLRLRYEFTRRFAPYVGVAWERAYGQTADLRRAAGHDVDDARFVLGLRTWF